MPMVLPCREAWCPNYQPCPAHPIRPFLSGGGRGEPMPPDWPRKSMDCLRRARFRCQLCGQKATQADHIIPRAMGGTDDPGNLQALCTHCHAVKTGRQGGVSG